MFNTIYFPQFFDWQVDFNLQTKWTEFSFLYLYEMFFKANTLRDDQNFFKPVSQLKTSVIVWYLTNPKPPCHVVGHLTASQVKSIWGITEEELEEMYFDDSGTIFVIYYENVFCYVTDITTKMLSGERGRDFFVVFAKYNTKLVFFAMTLKISGVIFCLCCLLVY